MMISRYCLVGALRRRKSPVLHDLQAFCRAVLTAACRPRPCQLRVPFLSMPGYCTDGSCLGAFHDSRFALSRVPRSAYICSHCVSGTVCARLCASDGILRLSSTAFDRQQVACISSAGEGISRGSRGRPGRWQSAGSALMKLRKSASRGSRIKTGKSAFKQAVFAYSESKRRIKNGFCGDMPEQSSRPA